MSTPIRLEVLVDFIDDALTAAHPLTERDIDGMMALLAAAGVRRVVWAYYGDGHGGLRMPAGLADGKCSWANCQDTYRRLANPLRVAAAAAHRHGMEIHAYFKPYETGVSMVIPEGTPDATACGLLPHLGGRLAVLDPFVVAHPQLRIQRRTDDLPVGQDPVPVCALRLTKRDAGPTRITAAHLQIWASPDNHRYQQAQLPFTFTDSVQPAARDVRDQHGVLVTRHGEAVRILTLSGLHLEAPYILVTTDFRDGPADFANCGTELLTALDAGGREIPGVFATGAAVWLASRIHFRDWGLVFDYGWGRGVTTLDEPNTSGRAGIIAFRRGRNAFLPGALCETEPEVQAFWLQCLQEIADAGVDGVDVREENHCTHTDEPAAFGFNPVVLARCRPGQELVAEVARVRGDAYTEFLRRARRLLAPHSVRLRYHLNMDWFRPDPPPGRALAYPANLCFDWQRWLAEGLLDEAVLRSYHHRQAMLTDTFGAELVARCQASGIPISYNHHVFADEPWYREEAERVAGDGRFAGLILYESQSFLRMLENGASEFTLAVVSQICRDVRPSVVQPD